MHWLELSIKTPGEFAEPIASLFARHGDGRVVIEQPGGFNPDEGESPSVDAPVRVLGWLPLDATTHSRRAMIDVGIRLVSYLQPLPPMNEREVDETEWRNQRFEPTRIGRRLVIVPPGEAYAKRPRDIVIPLEPGLAFGTGHHPTTRMCLTALDRAVRKGDSVLDVGCGTAVLSIAALKLGAARAICLDIDGDAVRAALANLARAGVIDRAAVAQGGLPHEFAPEHGFDIVCANISANIIISLAGHLMATLCEGGLLIVSGILEGRGAEVEAALLGAGGAVTATGQSGEWLVHEVRHATWHERLAEELVRGREPLGGLQGRPT